MLVFFTNYKFSIIRNYLLLSLFSLCITAGYALAGSVSYVSNINSATPTLSSYHFLLSDSFSSMNGSECGTLTNSSETGPVHYYIKSFYVDQDGTYSITNSHINGFNHRSIYLHCDLNINDLRYNILAARKGNSSYLSLNNIQLKANRTYYLTVIPVSINNTGSYETEIIGPGNIYFGSYHHDTGEDEKVAISKSVESAISDIGSNNAKSVSSSSSSSKGVAAKAFSSNQSSKNNINFSNDNNHNSFEMLGLLITPKLDLNPDDFKVEASMDLEYSGEYFGSVSYVYEDVFPSDKSVLDKSGNINIVNFSLGYKINENELVGFSVSHDNADINNKTALSKYTSTGNMGTIFYAYKLNDNINLMANSGMKSAKHSITSDNFVGEYKVKSNTVFAEASINYSDALVEDAIYLSFDGSTKLVRDKYELESDAGTGKDLIYDEVLYGNLNGGFELRFFEYDDNLNIYQPFLGASYGKFFDYTKRNKNGDDELDNDLKSAIENESTHFELFAGLDYNFDEIHTLSGRVYMNKVEGNEPYIRGISLTYAVDF